MTTYRFLAFISYSHRNIKIARWLQRHLESYKMPTANMHPDIAKRSRYLRPIFRDQSDLNAGVLSEELHYNLTESKFLILICSKASSQSLWVSDEVKTFVEMGRLANIIPILVPDGETPDRELFPIFLRQYFTTYPDKELLGISLGEPNRHKVLIRVVSRMLNVSFDTLWKRHQRHLRIKIATILSAAVLASAAAYIYVLPANISVTVDTEKSTLPVGDNITITVNGATYSESISNNGFPNIRLAGYKRFSPIRIHVESQFFEPIDTAVRVGIGLKRHVNLFMHRDATFSSFSGTVYTPEMQPLSDVKVDVASSSDTTDTNGRFSITLPLADQKEFLPISLSKPGFSTIYCDDESPGIQLKYIMHPVN